MSLSSYSTDSQTSEEGSTPKRPKLRPAPKNLPERALSNIDTSPIPKLLHKKGSERRTALRSISPNRRHTTVGVTGPIPNGGAEGRYSLPLERRQDGLSGNKRTRCDVDIETGVPCSSGTSVVGARKSHEDGSDTEP